MDGITGDSYDDNDIQGNFIGTNAAGTAALPNGFAGIVVRAGRGTRSAGATAGSDNVISGNGKVGVLLTHPGEGSSATQNEVLGNKIGTNAAGSGPIPNGGPGIQAHIAGRNVIGRPGEGNTIANNDGDGVLIGGTPGQFGSDVFEINRNSIRGNSIFANGQLGIDLGEDGDDPLDDGDGVTPNDAGDQDIGNNDKQNFPLVNAALPGSSTFVRGFINSTPNTAYTIDLYRPPRATPPATARAGSSSGRRRQPRTASATRCGARRWRPTVPLGEFVTATATDPFGNTSEFSACRESGTQVADPAIAPPDEQASCPRSSRRRAAAAAAAGDPAPQGPQPNPCSDRRPPITTLKKAGVKNDKRGAKLSLNGRSADHRDCPSGVAGSTCRWRESPGGPASTAASSSKPNRTGLTRPQNCRRPVLFKATGTDKWAFTFPVRLPSRASTGSQARGTDRARNKETPKKNRNIVFFVVR